MKQQKKLFLASKSSSRKNLLKEMNIDFTVIGQYADETKCDWALPLEQVVMSIAQYKMKHAIMPEGKKDEECFVLTADTLTQDLDGDIHGKPMDRADAIHMIKSARGGQRAATAFCLELKEWQGDSWKTKERIHECVQAQYLFEIPDEWIGNYMETTGCLETAGAIIIESFGGQFLKMINGSYSAIMGMPQFELRKALEKLGFYQNR